MPDGFAKDGVAVMFKHYYQSGFHGGHSLILKKILGRKPTALPEYFDKRNNESLQD